MSGSGGGAAAAVEPLDLAHLSLDSFRERPVVVLGLARSGIALCRFLADHGAIVTGYDARSAAELAPALDKLEGRAVQLMLGPDVDPRAALADQTLICTSPSVSSRYPTTEPRLRAALAQIEADARVPVVSEVDLFLRLCPATTIGVTGTKGKTTTSSLTAAVLAAGPNPVVLGGNIGIPLVEQLPTLTPDHRVVLELSELQLPTISRGTDVAVYTHVSSDHLDRHGTLGAYRAVKRRLAELLPPTGTLVLNAEDPVSSEFAEATKARVIFYRRSEPLPGGLGVFDDWIVDDRRRRIMPTGELLIPGAHNISNALAAVAVGVLFGIAPDAIRRAAANFLGVEHRLEPVASFDGVTFINDSQGTQPDAVIAALRSFEPPIVLIAGGRGKNLDMTDLAREVAARAAAVVLIGEAADEFEGLFAAAGAANIERAATLEEAIDRGHAIAMNFGGGTVLMSPAATSFDMFVDYAARGAAFKAAVSDLAARRAAQKDANP
ncbi:MAG: UDP-N-acetylmuramoyl-L-alanine--D-glutamate ligase [Candidatus Limnocylindrales bacterium]